MDRVINPSSRRPDPPKSGIGEGYFREVDPHLTIRSLIGPIVLHMLMAEIFGIVPEGGLSVDKLVDNHLSILFSTGCSAKQTGSHKGATVVHLLLRGATCEADVRRWPAYYGIFAWLMGLAVVQSAPGVGHGRAGRGTCSGTDVTGVAMSRPTMSVACAAVASAGRSSRIAVSEKIA